MQVVSYDVSQAFLQGLNLKDLEKRGEIKRQVYFDPPQDAWGILKEALPEKFHMVGTSKNQYEITLQATKGVYGLGDAPR